MESNGSGGLSWFLLQADDIAVHQAVAARHCQVHRLLHEDASALVVRETAGLRLRFITADVHQRRAAEVAGLDVVWVE